MNLTRRETEALLHLAADGAPDKIIARRMGVELCTVKAHIKNALQKIKATNRTQGALWARENLET